MLIDGYLLESLLLDSIEFLFKPTISPDYFSLSLHFFLEFTHNHVMSIDYFAHTFLRFCHNLYLLRQSLEDGVDCCEIMLDFILGYCESEKVVRVDFHFRYYIEFWGRHLMLMTIC